ncbi:hypothetical protein [Kitasatospora albolonga]
MLVEGLGHSLPRALDARLAADGCWRTYGRYRSGSSTYGRRRRPRTAGAG